MLGIVGESRHADFLVVPTQRLPVPRGGDEKGTQPDGGITWRWYWGMRGPMSAWQVRLNVAVGCELWSSGLAWEICVVSFCRKDTNTIFLDASQDGDMV
jgi:hypothetical protein